MSSRVKIEGFDELQKKLKRVPEKLRAKTVRKILTREANPLVWAARKLAYADSAEPEKISTKQAGGQGSAWIRNLAGSIGVYPNKKAKDYYYVVVGLRSRKRSPAGAFYAPWQNTGGTEKNFVPKHFIEDAEREQAQRVNRKQYNAVNKEVDKIIRELF